MSTTAVVQSAGAKLYVGGTGALDSESMWTEVGEITNMGEFGRQYQKVTHNPIGNKQTFKKKGARDDGAMQLDLGRAPSDAGQTALRTALDSELSHNFKVTLDDNPAASSGSLPTTFLFQGLVMSYTTNINDVNSIVHAKCTIEIQGDIEETEAA
jgi:hypothetical protein